MIVDADPAAGTVTMRLSSAALALRGVLALVLGVGAPVLAERAAPDLLVPALLVTAASGALLVAGLGRTVVLDDHGVTVGASRRRPRRIAWREVDGLSTEDGRLVVARTDGGHLRGPPCGTRTLARALQDAAVLGLLPRAHER